MSETPHSSDPTAASFDEIISDFGTMSPEVQQGIFHDTLSAFAQDWKDTGITAKLFDLTQSDSLDSISLRRTTSSGLERYFFIVCFRIPDDEGELRPKYGNAFIYQIHAGVRTPVGRFDEYDATCVARQVAKLEQMKADGILPNLTDSLGFINDPVNSRSLPPKK